MNCKHRVVVLVHRPPSWAGKRNVYRCECGQDDCTGFQEYSTTYCDLTPFKPCTYDPECPDREPGQSQIEVRWR